LVKNPVSKVCKIFLTMSALQVSLIQDAIPDFSKRNYVFFTNEDNLAVLNAMENLQDEIVKFEHMLVLLLSFL
jgi:hypothetical protein